MLASGSYHADNMTVDFGDGKGKAKTTITGSNVGAGSTSGDGNSYIARLEAEKAALRHECRLEAGKG